MKAKEFIPAEKPRNFVAKNAKMGGAGQHKDKKKAEKQGDFKHKNKQYAEDVAEGKSGAKYKIKSIGYEGGKDYYISPNTGKKVYKKAKVGDHETPGGEHKPEVRMPYKENVADEGVLSFLKTEPEKKKWDPAKDSRVTGNKQDNNGWIKLLIDKHRRGIPLTDREWNSIEQWKLKRAMSGESTEIQELSTDKLALYKKAAGADAKKADADGDYARGDKRFKGINRATNKQFDNDLKKHSQKDVAERARDPEDWDEGNTEPPNNFAVYINGKKWKVFKGRGRYADDNREQAHYQQLKDWAAKKSADTGKKWTVSITGEAATE